MKDSKIQVSVVCTAYNQEKYIADALNSFVMQKTNFPFEIIVHDDASTDRTPEIIKDYAERYPEIIIPILETENQYSKHDGSIRKIIKQYVRGKYRATCEGDDFWIDEYKLQKQYDYMENNPDCFLCANAWYSQISSGKRFEGHYRHESCDISIDDAINGFGRIVATCSFFCKAELYDYTPAYQEVSPCGDYIMPIKACEKGKVHYIDDIMSVYRELSSTSLTSSWNNDPEKFRVYMKQYYLMLDKLDEHFTNKYHSLIEKERNRITTKYYLLANDEILKTKEYREKLNEYLKNYSFKGKMKIYCQIHAPLIISLYNKIK